MSKIVDQNGGIVVEFIGDAILCIYGAPVVNDKHPTVAVMAAVPRLKNSKATRIFRYVFHVFRAWSIESKYVKMSSTLTIRA